MQEIPQMYTKSELEDIIHEYIKNNLSIDEKREHTSDYSGREYINISIKLDNKEISSIYIDV